MKINNKNVTEENSKLNQGRNHVCYEMLYSYDKMYSFLINMYKTEDGKIGFIQC